MHKDDKAKYHNLGIVSNTTDTDLKSQPFELNSLKKIVWRSLP